MDKQKIVRRIKEEHPNKEIFLDPPGSDNPTEIIVELEPASEHPERSLALAVVGKSAPHYHKVSTEIYESVEGDLTVIVDNEKHILKPGEKFTITPGQIHSAEGENVWFLTHSTPGWTPEDHIVVEQ